LADVSMSKETQECSYLLFRIVFTSVHGNPLISLDPVPKIVFDFGWINDCPNSLQFSTKLCIVIVMEIGELILSAREQATFADC
jgi:hypothetical protein